jgi:RNA polymerase sigma-70 factor (ECF subfamily)
MAQLAKKHDATLDECVAALLTRAEKARSVTPAEVKPRVAASVEKYLLSDGADAERAEIRAFVDEIRADDLCLVLACERGDADAWEELVASFDSTVRSAARKISQNSEDAEDLASSIWAELYGLRQDADGKKKSKLAYYSGRGSLAGWLRAVVSQLAVDQYRRQSKFVQIEEEREFENLANEASSNDGNGVVSHSDDPESLLTDRRTADDVAAALQTAITSLEAEDRLVLKMYYFDDLKLKDIAATFGYHEATASRKLVRVQTEIRKAVERELRQQHGWTESEVKRYLSETAAGLGINLETMFAALLALAVVQDLLYGGVL